MKLKSNLTFDNVIKSYKEQHSYEFDEYQLFELKTGFDDGLNIDLFAYPYFNDEIMYAIRSVLYTYREYLHDTRTQRRAVQYVLDDYDGLQIRELVIGLSKGLKVELYENRDLSYHEMQIIRQGLESEADTAKLSTVDEAYKKFVKF
jgi:hypothetical protein